MWYITLVFHLFRHFKRFILGLQKRILHLYKEQFMVIKRSFVIIWLIWVNTLLIISHALVTIFTVFLIFFIHFFDCLNYGAILWYGWGEFTTWFGRSATSAHFLHSFSKVKWFRVVVGSFLVKEAVGLDDRFFVISLLIRKTESYFFFFG